jgi:hypothetical protein
VRDIDFSITIDPDALERYHAEGFHGTMPGADWMIGDRRFRETSRTPTPTGALIKLVEVAA